MGTSGLGCLFFCRPINIDLTEEEEKDEDDISNIVDLYTPTVRTEEVILINSRETQLSGYVSNDNGSAVIERGFVWGQAPQPALGSANKIIAGKGVGAFSSVLTNLQRTLTFYYRAFATNGAGTSYGKEMSFTLESEPQANMSLNGKWLSGIGTGVDVLGNNGKFYAFSNSLQPSVDLGIVKIGDLKFKNIVMVSSNKWSFQEMLIKRTGGVPVEQVWSYDGEIVMSNDGKLITTTTNAMLDGVSQRFTTSYSRQ